MADRLSLHAKLKQFIPNVYFQPPATITMKYPCIVYNKTGKNRMFSNDGIYLSHQEYQVLLIEHDPDSTIADEIEETLPSCVISRYYVVDNLNHTALNLYY